MGFQEKFLFLALVSSMILLAYQQTSPEDRCVASVESGNTKVCLNCTQPGTCVKNSDGTYSVVANLARCSTIRNNIFCDDSKFATTPAQYGVCSPLPVTYTDCGCTKPDDCLPDPNDPFLLLQCETTTVSCGTASSTSDFSTTVISTFESSTPESSTFESSSLGSSTFGSSTLGSSTFESSTLGSSTVESSTAASSTFESSTLGSSTFESSTPASSTFESSTLGSSTFESSTPGSSTFQSSTLGSSTFESSTPGSSTFGSSTPGSSTFESSTPGSPTFESSTLGSSTFGSSTPGPTTTDSSSPTTAISCADDCPFTDDPSSDDCGKYLYCSGDELSPQDCPIPLCFNETLCSCVEPVTTVSTAAPTTTPGVTCNDECPFAKDTSTDDCATYFYCSEQGLISQVCPNKLCFNETLCSCVESPGATCTDECPFAKDTDTNDCTKYFYCYNDQVLSYSCPSGLCFIEEECSCIVTTTTTKKPTTTTTSTTTSTPTSTPTSTTTRTSTSTTTSTPTSTPTSTTISTSTSTTTSTPTSTTTSTTTSTPTSTTTSTPTSTTTSTTTARCTEECPYVDDPNDDCQNFFICDGDNLLPHTCTGTLCFNQATCQCDI